MRSLRTEAAVDTSAGRQQGEQAVTWGGYCLLAPFRLCTGRRARQTGTSDALRGFNHPLKSPRVLSRAHPMPSL